MADLTVTKIAGKELAAARYFLSYHDPAYGDGLGAEMRIQEVLDSGSLYALRLDGKIIGTAAYVIDPALNFFWLMRWPPHAEMTMLTIDKSQRGQKHFWTLLEPLVKELESSGFTSFKIRTHAYRKNAAALYEHLVDMGLATRIRRPRLWNGYVHTFEASVERFIKHISARPRNGAAPARSPDLTVEGNS